MAQLAGEAIHVALARPAPPRAVGALSADRARLLPVLGLFALAALVSLLYVSQASTVANAGYEVGSLEATRDNWRLRNEQLELKIAEARSLETVEREARRLGMGKPERVVFLRVPPPSLPVVQPGLPKGPDPTWLESTLAWLRGLW